MFCVGGVDNIVTYKRDKIAFIAIYIIYFFIVAINESLFNIDER